MSRLIGLLSDSLRWMSSRMYPSRVTYRQYLDPTYQDLLKNGVSHVDAQWIAEFVKKVAKDADAPQLDALAGAVIASSNAIDARPEARDPPEDWKTAQWGTQNPEFWRKHDERERKRQTEIATRASRWDARERVTTTDIAGRLWPDEEPGYTTYVFHVLKDLGYVDGAPRSWTLTGKGRVVGEMRGKFIYWAKELLEVVRTELDRRRQAGDFVPGAASMQPSSTAAEHQNPPVT